jgi:3-methyladenine DNA glycosylase AlkD
METSRRVKVCNNQSLEINKIVRNETRNKHQLLQKIRTALKGPLPQAKVHANYLGAQGHKQRTKDEQSTLIFWGHPVPKLRNLSKDLNLTWDEALSLWRSTDIFDIKSMALYSLVDKKRGQELWFRIKDLEQLVQEIDNWVHSDVLSDVFAQYLEMNPRFLKTLKKWNTSKNPWLRRQSLVSIYYYARFRKDRVPAATSLKLVEELLDDPHFYVQRGIGWALREIDHVDSKLQRAFVKKQASRISGVAWFATSELYSVKERKRLVELRKAFRSQKRKPAL